MNTTTHVYMFLWRNKKNISTFQLKKAPCLTVDYFFQRFISKPDLDNLEKDELVELYHKYIIPLPQRKYRQNRRGRQMTKQQEQLAKKRKLSTVEDNTEPPKKK